MKSLNELGQQYYEFDQDSNMLRTNNDILAHIMSELGEAFTCIRKNRVDLYFDVGQNMKPEGLGPELADIIILTFKLAAYNGIDLDRMIKLKHDYNLTRLPWNKAKGAK